MCTFTTKFSMLDNNASQSESKAGIAERELYLDKMGATTVLCSISLSVMCLATILLKNLVIGMELVVKWGVGI